MRTSSKAGAGACIGVAPSANHVIVNLHVAWHGNAGLSDAFDCHRHASTAHPEHTSAMPTCRFGIAKATKQASVDMLLHVVEAT